MTPQTEGENTVKAAKTAFHILETLEEHDELRLTELAEELDLAKSTAHRYLQTLQSMGYLVREDNHYSLSHRFLHFGTHVRTRDPRYELIDGKVEQVAETTDELVQFITEEHGQAVYVLQAVGENAVKIDTKTGKHDPIHTTAGGKAILSTWPREAVEDHIAEHGLRKLTPHSITDEETLFEELAEIRDLGYSINDQENLKGLKAISVPIVDSNGEAIGALSVSGPTNRMQGEWFEMELPNHLLGVSNELELNFRFLNG